MSALPFIGVNISQPGDKGEFLISVSDIRTKQVILTNRLKEDRSAFDYLYNSRLIEGGGMGVALSKDAISEDKKRDRLNDMTRYGQRLYQDLFGRDDALKRYMAKQPHFANGACFVLRLFDTASELWNIPWEYIHDGTEFVGLNPKFPILRFLVDSKPARANLDLNELPNPLRILFVISSPRNATALNVEAEISRIQRAIKPAHDKGLVEVEYVEQATLQNLENALTKGDFHVLHYSGHGTMTNKGSMLVLENDKGMVELAPLEKLLPVINKAPNLRMVFLSACKAGNINETLASSGIATGLMKVVPAVLAMQFSILDRSANELSEAFYTQIGQGATLEEALFASRKALHQNNEWLGDWGVPALYLYKPNIRLVDTTQERKPTATPSIAPKHDLSGLPQPEPFIGRRDEQNKMRDALKKSDLPFIYIWGMAGVGKSALVHQIIKRPGQDVVLNDVLVLRCDQMKISDVVTTFQAWLMKHFPTIRNQMAGFSKNPREVIRQVAEQIQGKKLMLVLDGMDSLMTTQDDKFTRFTHPMVEELMIGLARADWSIVTVMTSRLCWHYITQIPENAFLDVHLNNLSPTDVNHLVTEHAIFKTQDDKQVNEFCKMVGGHTATFDFMGKVLATKPHILADTRLQSSLVSYWQKSFLADVLAMLSAEERDLLKLMSIHDSLFIPQMVQQFGNLITLESAAYTIVTWEKLSLADFIGTDSNDVTYYTIPNLVRTYLTSTMDADEKRQLHAQFAEVMEDNFFEQIRDALQRGGGNPALANKQNKFGTVLQFLPHFLENPNPDQVYRHLDLTITWQKHCREAGMIDRANQIVLAFISRLHDFGNVEATDELIKTVRQSGKVPPDTDLQLQYWSAVRLIDERQYARASQLIDILEGKTKGQAHYKTLHANILERQGEIARGLGDAKRADKIWIQALDEYEALKDKFGSARILFYFTEQSYYNKELDKAKSRIDRALLLLKSEHETGVVVQLLGKLLLYNGHIARQQNKGIEAIHYYSTVLDIGMSIGEGNLIAQGFEHIGYYYGLLKQYEIASIKLLQALDVYEQLKDQTGLSMVLMKLAVVHEFKGDAKEALAFCERSYRIAQKYTLAHLNDVEAMYKRLKKKG